MQAAAIRHHVLVHDLPSPRRSWLLAALEKRGFQASACDCLDAALAGLGREAADAADLILLRCHGSAAEELGLLRRIREVSGVPVVLLGGPGASFGDRVAALEGGADDYLGAGMPLQEVLARLRAVLRRTSPGARRQPAPSAAAAPDGGRLIEGGWRLAVHRRALVAEDGEALPLTGAEFELLRLLSGAAGEPVDRDTISRAVFRRPWQVEDRAVDGLVKRLRRKLQADAIASVRSIGYALRFAEPAAVRSIGLRSRAELPAQVEICARDTARISGTLQSAVAD